MSSKWIFEHILQQVLEKNSFLHTFSGFVFVICIDLLLLTLGPSFGSFSVVASR